MYMNTRLQPQSQAQASSQLHSSSPQFHRYRHRQRLQQKQHSFSYRYYNPDYSYNAPSNQNVYMQRLSVVQQSKMFSEMGVWELRLLDLYLTSLPFQMRTETIEYSQHNNQRLDQQFYTAIFSRAQLKNIFHREVDYRRFDIYISQLSKRVLDCYIPTQLLDIYPELCDYVVVNDDNNGNDIYTEVTDVDTEDEDTGLANESIDTDTEVDANKLVHIVIKVFEECEYKTYLPSDSNSNTEIITTCKTRAVYLRMNALVAEILGNSHPVYYANQQLSGAGTQIFKYKVKYAFALQNDVQYKLYVYLKSREWGIRGHNNSISLGIVDFSKMLGIIDTSRAQQLTQKLSMGKSVYEQELRFNKGKTDMAIIQKDFKKLTNLNIDYEFVKHRIGNSKPAYTHIILKLHRKSFKTIKRYKQNT